MMIGFSFLSERTGYIFNTNNDSMPKLKNYGLFIFAHMTKYNFEQNNTEFQYR